MTGFYLVVWDVEHQVIVHRHDPEVAAVPWFPVVDPEPLRHLVQLEDVLLQAIQLTVGVLLRLQVYCDVAVDFRRSCFASGVSVTS